MKIGIDISQIVYKGTGVARFTDGLVHAILDYDQENTWVFFASLLRQKIHTDLIQKIQSKGHTFIHIPFPPSALSFTWNNLHVLSIENFTGKLDWFISSDWTEPPTQCKKATIIHDLVFKRFPETVDTTILKTQEKRLQHVRKESHVIFTDSFSSKEDIQHFLDISEDKIHVIYPGLTVQKPSFEQINTTFKKYNITQPFILTVGKIEPRKNLTKLIEAYKKLEKEHNNLPQLLLVGPQGWENIQSLQSEHIKMLGQISDEDLYALYASCVFFMFPSIWEGFGYPAIEAMQLGAPTALSNTSSLGEIGEDVSLLFDPNDVQAIQKAILTMTEDKFLRESLREKGIKKAKQFTWETYYNQFIRVLKENS